MSGSLPLMSSPPALKRIWNPPNPYLSEHCELLEEAPVAELEVWEDSSRSILSENESPDVGFRWSVNPYRGCFHACAYCYARRTHEYLGLGAGTDFERKILVKPRAPELLEEAFRRRGWRGEVVAFSGVTDCYQPLEAAWKLTRGCLEVCERHANPVIVVTKSQLVRRDADLLKRVADRAWASVAISIPFRSEDVTRRLEPGAPTVKRRFETMEALAAAGVPVGISVAPIIPGLNDADIPALLQEAKRRGATSAFRVLLRLPGSVRPVFLRRLSETMPLRAARIESRIRDVRGGRLNDSRLGLRGRGQGRYWDAIDRVWSVWTRRLGFRDRAADPAAAAPPARGSLQQELPW